MDLLKSLKKLRLESFNNLTKTLSFNIYDICYAPSEQAQKEYLAYIDEAYNAERLTAILSEVANIIGANILNIAHQDYDPQGASVTMLISELPIQEEPLNPEAPGPLPDEAHNRQSRTADQPGARERPRRQGIRGGASRQEPHHRAHLSGIASG